ncbi:MAG: type II secretion system protein [Phycisphaerales bacterium]
MKRSESVCHSTQHAARGLRRAFSLIELMIVLVVLITLIAIFTPVLRGARNASRRVATLQLINNIQAASSAFELDSRRLPGAFTPSQMGAASNATRGFSNMQNILAELSGGIVASGTPSARRIAVGPAATGTILLDLDLINAPVETKGVVKNVYYTIDKKYWVSHAGAGQKAPGTLAEHVTLPDVVDSFSNPLLVWVEDTDAAPGDPFASIASSTRAKFYWNGNAVFLRATSLGGGAKDQTDSFEGSLLATAAQMEVQSSMHGLLGNPAFPAAQATPNSQVFPAAARGKFVFHSAGADGIYLGRRDRGGLIAAAPSSSNPFHLRDVVDYSGRLDPMDNFDDIITSGGN